MLKIKDFAEGKKMSQNAIYKAILREGHSAKELTDKKGNITAAGFRILNKIYPGEVEEMQRNPEKEKDGILDQLKEADKIREQLEREATSLREQLAEAKSRADKWEKMCIEQQEKASQERSEMLQQLKASQVLLAQQQEINSRLLMNPIKRLFAGRKKEREPGGKVE